MTLSVSQRVLQSPRPIPPDVRNILNEREVPVTVESDEEWLQRASRGGIRTSRVRLIGGDPLTGATEAASALARALVADLDDRLDRGRKVGAVAGEHRGEGADAWSPGRCCQSHGTFTHHCRASRSPSAASA